MKIQIANINMRFTHLCDDELNIIINFLPFDDIWSVRLLNTNYKKFMDSDFKLENCVHRTVNINIVNRYRKYLQKIVITGYSGNDVYDDDMIDLCNLKILALPYNQKITDDGLKYISGIQKLDLYRNKNITDTLARNEHEALLATV